MFTNFISFQIFYQLSVMPVVKYFGKLMCFCLIVRINNCLPLLVMNIINTLFTIVQTLIRKTIKYLFVLCATFQYLYPVGIHQMLLQELTQVKNLKLTELRRYFIMIFVDNDCQSDPAKSNRKVFTNKCSVKGCKNKEVIPITCKECTNNYCLKHRHTTDHQCEGKAAAARKRNL